MRRSLSEGMMERWTDGTWWHATILGFACLSIVPTFHLSAQDLPLNAGALFLVFPVGAQAVGMGQTAMGAEGHGEAAFWNPAGLATMETNEFALHSATLVAGRSHVLGAYFPSRGIGVLGGAVYLVDYGDLDRTDANGNTIARIAPRNFEFLASYATQLAGSFVFGVNYKLVQFRVDCSGDCTNFPVGHGTTHAIDLGGQFRVGPGGPLRVGVALRNVGFKLQVQNKPQADPLPARLGVGAQYLILLPMREGAAPGERFDLLVAADVDSPWGHPGQSELRFGFDVGYQRLVRVRAGLSGPSVGLGLESGSIGVDLARTFLTGSDLIIENPTFFSFRVTF